jgi:ligand-binding SRPBCC domain-containing protein
MGRVMLETRIGAPIEHVFDAARSIDVHVTSMAWSGERAIGGRLTGLIGPDETVTWQARHFGVTMRLTSRITSFERPGRFVDEQIDGPFASFRHEHRFAADPGGTLMTDDWVHRSPLGLIGRVVDRLVLDRYMLRQLRTRAKAIRLAAESVRRDRLPFQGGGTAL